MDEDKNFFKDLRAKMLAKLFVTQMLEYGELKDKYRQGLPVDTTELYRLKRKVRETETALITLNDELEVQA